MKTTGWAIKTSFKVDGKVYTSFLGKYYFGRPGSLPEHFDGYQVAVFATRQQARDAARITGRGYDRATAVRVKVSVVEQR